MFALLGSGPAWCQWGLEPEGREIEYFRHASLVFATNDLSSPASLFGHTFIVLYNEETPEPQALVLEFGGIARTELDQLRALVAEIEGGFTLSFFSYKEREYFAAGRSLWIYPLRLDARELVALKQLVRDSIGQRARYTFARWNCAHYILDLVARASGIERDAPELPFVVPSDTLRALYSRQLLGQPTFKANPGTRGQAAYRALAADDRSRFRSFWLDPDQPLGQPLSAELQAALSVSAEHWMLSEAQPQRRDAWFRLKRQFPLGPAEVAAPKVDPAASRSSGEWTLALDGRSGAVALGWRLGLLSLAGEERTGLHNATLQPMALEVERRQGRLRVTRADLIAMDAHVPGDLFFRGFTQRLHLGYGVDDGFLNRPSRRLLARFGRGITGRLGIAELSILPTLSSGAVTGGREWRLVASAGFRASIYSPLIKGWRLRLTTEWNGRELAGVRSSHQIEAASPVLRDAHTLTLRAEWRNEHHRAGSLGFQWGYRWSH